MIRLTRVFSQRIKGCESSNTLSYCCMKRMAETKLLNANPIVDNTIYIYIYIYIYDTTRPLMLYVAYDTPTSKCLCLSTIFKIKAILAK